MSYGLSKELITSGDLRYHLALSPGETSPEHLALQASFEQNNLLSFQGQQLVYNVEYCNKREIYLNSLRQSRAPFSCAHSGGIALLCGAGWSRNDTLTDAANNKGVITLGVGTGGHSNTSMQYWTGSGCPTDYPIDILSSGKSIKFVPNKYASNKFFSAHTMMLKGKPVSSYTGVILFQEDALYRDIMGNVPENSFYMGLYMAIRLGITDIYLNGIDFGKNPTTGAMYFGRISASPSFINGKLAKYKEIVEDYNNRLHDILINKYFVRLYSPVNIGLDKVMVIPMTCVIACMDRRESASRGSVITHRPELTQEEKRAMDDITRVLNLSRLKPPQITEDIPELVKQFPQIFNTEKVLQDIKGYAAAKIGTKCSDCTKSSYSNHAYRLLLSALTGPYKEDIFAFWKTRWTARCFQNNRTYIFPPWESEVAAKYEEIQNKLK